MICDYKSKTQFFKYNEDQTFLPPITTLNFSITVIGQKHNFLDTKKHRFLLINKGHQFDHN